MASDEEYCDLGHVSGLAVIYMAASASAAAMPAGLGRRHANRKAPPALDASRDRASLSVLADEALRRTWLLSHQSARRAGATVGERYAVV